jgi:hypothetical protein
VAKGDDAKQARFIEWLCTPKRERQPATQEELARSLHVTAAKLSRWKRDVAFLRAWEAHYLSTIGSPERKLPLLDALHRTGSDPDDPHHVAAAKAYMDIVDGLRPQQIEVTVKRPAQELSDEQLDAILSRHAEQERKLRLVDEAS